MKKKLALALITIPLAGCVHTVYEDGKGGKFSRWSIGSTAQIGEVTIPTPNGPATVKGYSNDQVATASAVVEAAVRGAIK